MYRDELVTTAAIVIIGIFISGTNETMAQNATSATSNETVSQLLAFNHGYFHGYSDRLMGGTTSFCDPSVNGTKNCASFKVGYDTGFNTTNTCVSLGNVTLPCTFKGIIKQGVIIAVGNKNMTKYADPQGRFSIYYPSDWTPVPATNRFQSVLVTFSNQPYSVFDIAVVHGSVATDPSVVANEYNTNPLSIPFGDSIFQNMECVKYQIDGQKACSVILTGTNPTSQVPIVIEQVISYVHGTMFVFNLSGTQDSFDSYLPTFQSMLASFKAPSASVNSTR